MEIAVVGATGTLGRAVVAELRGRGRDVRLLGRSSAEHPVDVTTGAGLHDALAGCGAVVDATNAPGRGAGAVLVEGTRRLLAAEAECGVAHHVCVSIVGIERVPMSYYRTKLRQEEAVHAGGVPFSIVRATQFHDLVAALLAGFARRRVSPRSRARLQPVDVTEVARVVADVAIGEPLGATTTVAGPEPTDLSGLARTWATHTGRRGVPLPLPLPPRLGRALRAGGLTCAEPDVHGTTGFAAWLAARG